MRLQLPTYIILTMISFGLLSCTRDMNDSLSSLTIFGNGSTGKTLSGVYEINEYRVERDSSSIIISVLPQEFNYAPSNPADYDKLWESVLYGKLIKDASDEEAFAYECITERIRPLSEQFEQYCRQLLTEGYLNKKSAKAAFINVYVKGLPSIKADGILFGQPAGGDLSEWFRFGDKNVISISGTDYKMENKGDIINAYQQVSEYFTFDRMMPLQLYICTATIPEEITLSEFPVRRYAGDDVIRVTVTIPVRFERYWEWCRALYSNPNAEETFIDGNIQFVIPFIRKP